MTDIDRTNPQREKKKGKRKRKKREERGCERRRVATPTGKERKEKGWLPKIVVPSDNVERGGPRPVDLVETHESAFELFIVQVLVRDNVTEKHNLGKGKGFECSF